jgi:hypothetical protein
VAAEVLLSRLNNGAWTDTHVLNQDAKISIPRSGAARHEISRIAAMELLLWPVGACAGRCGSGSRSLFVRPRERRQLGRACFDDGDKNTQRDAVRCEDVTQGQSCARQTGLHGWRPGFAPASQRPVRSDEVVMATREFDVAAEQVGAMGVAGRAPPQVRRRLPNREVEALDERGVQDR